MSNARSRLGERLAVLDGNRPLDVDSGSRIRSAADARRSQQITIRGTQLTGVSDWIWLGFYECRTLFESNALIGNWVQASITSWIFCGLGN